MAETLSQVIVRRRAASQRLTPPRVRNEQYLVAHSFFSLPCPLLNHYLQIFADAQLALMPQLSYHGYKENYSRPAKVPLPVK